jgi:hypothetical protein
MNRKLIPYGTKLPVAFSSKELDDIRSCIMIGEEFGRHALGDRDFRPRLVFIGLRFDCAAQSGGRKAWRRHLPERLFQKTLAQAQFPLRSKCQ